MEHFSQLEDFGGNPPIWNYQIEGDLAVLSDGPASGTAIVVVGAAELFGAETGIGK